MPHSYSSGRHRLLFYICLFFAFILPETSFANTTTAPATVVIAAPQVYASPSVAGTISITWNSVANASQYTVEYSKISGSGFTVLQTVGASVTSYRHTNLGNAETLYYRVKVTGGGESAYSNVVTATTRAANYVYRVMPLGDSNTDGGSADLAREDRVAYRNELFQLLTNAKYKVDFVGSEVSGTNTSTAFQQKYGFAPDLNHAGFGGYKNYNIRDLLKNGNDGSGPYLDKYKPDIILLHIGTNSLGYPTNITELDEILNEVDAYETRSKQEVTVVLAQIIKQCTDCGANEEDAYWGAYYTAKYNEDLVKLANSRIANGDRIVLVDMADDAGIVYNQNADMYDFLHPNLNGYNKMARVWFGPVKTLLTTTDTQAPETQITAAPPATTTSKTATFSFASNESGVTYQASLDGAAFATIANPATLSNVADGTHTLKVRAVDASGNADTTPATHTWTVDATPPAAPAIVAITEDRGPVTNDRITSDNTLKLNGTAEANATVTLNLSGKGTIGTVKASTTGTWEYSYEATALTNGTYTFTATATDAMGNTSAASANFVVTIDQAAPTVAITTTTASPVNTAFDVTITFSEGVYYLATTDFIVTNAAISNLKSTGTATYTATITPTTDGKITVQLPAAKVTDLAGNSNTASGMLEMESDISKPTVVLATNAPEITNQAFEVTITFSENITGFEVSDITVANGTASAFKKVTDKTFIILVTPSAQGEVAVSIAAGKAQDAARNGNEASNIIKRQYDAVAPAGYAVKFAVAQVNVSNEKSIDLNITGAEVGASYTYSISSSNGGEPVNGSGTVSAAAFTIAGLNLSGLKDGMLTVTLYLTDRATNKGEAATAQVAKVSKDIASVTPSEAVKVPFNTAFSKVNLPQKVKVTYNTGEEDYLDVTWQQGNYNPKVAGKYTLTGTLKLAESTTNFSNRTGSIIVEVEPNQPPTNLTLSATSFTPNAQPTDVIGTFTTQDPEDDNFTYSLVAGEGDAQNAYFHIVNNELHLTSNSGLSGITAFNIRVQSVDPYNNTIQRTFKLTKAPYEPAQIKLVNAFSPDGDGINDTWTVPELRFYNTVEITVMDRAGITLFHSTDPEKGWDGKGKNGQVKQGAYFYIIQIKDTGLVQKGVVSVL
ncbi:Ig-like domain-containing protein [Pontibacter fetidus]|uniref:T9SS type B sorting domain-containing protein n=1 Tax=Pontibacter fetidus TaxID=2700082 RepID=A0A6B2H5B3_9BACT|nr:Ig-like domain-containing protein [Pontibacter fetidus]NDK55866.1 T9SS type B sorting domain-containing protein [Pontibacter fetidus]